jgi:hypothetical protein
MSEGSSSSHHYRARARIGKEAREYSEDAMRYEGLSALHLASIHGGKDVGNNYPQNAGPYCRYVQGGGVVARKGSSRFPTAAKLV